MKNKFTTYYISNNKQNISILLILASFALFIYGFAREIFKINSIVVALFLILIFLVFFYIKRHQIYVNNKKISVQGIFFQEDQIIDIKKIEDVTFEGKHIVNFSYEGIKYSFFTSKKLIKYIKNE
jgi:membrane protein YdbS with pleckstrin-like domain